MNSPTPLVSITIPTGNRRIFARQAINYAIRQTWPAVEIIVVDGGRDPLNLEQPPPLSPFRAFVRYERVDPSTTLGWRRNRAAELAQGQIIVHFDDDDWHSHTRVERQVRTLLAGADVTQTSDLLVWSIPKRAARRWPGRGHPEFTHGASYAYWRKLWEHEPFADVATVTPAGRTGSSRIEVNRNEDGHWLNYHRSRGANVVDSLDPSLFVYMVHARQTMAHAVDAITTEPETSEARALMGSDAVFYDELAEVMPAPAPARAFFDPRPAGGGWWNK